MSATWVVPELNTDFTTDFEDLLIDYIFAKWAITNPAKGTQAQPDPIAEPDRVSFKAGFPDYFRAYECNCLQTTTRVLETFGKSRWVFATQVQVLLRMKRLDRDSIEVNPQLTYMEQEIQRIVAQYKPDPNDIPGIKDLSFVFPASVVRIYDATDNYAKADWRSVVSIDMFYEKQNLNAS